jgi:hypothetical protein
MATIQRICTKFLEELACVHCVSEESIKTTDAVPELPEPLLDSVRAAAASKQGLGEHLMALRDLRENAPVAEEQLMALNEAASNFALHAREALRMLRLLGHGDYLERAEEVAKMADGISRHANLEITLLWVRMQQ